MKRLETIQTKDKYNDVFAIDAPDILNINHQYQVCGEDSLELATIQFQKGARHDDNPTNGVTDSDLLEMVRDRLLGFQNTTFRSVYNEVALFHVEKALEALNQRIEDME